MSAYVVDDRHIDALLTAALDLPLAGHQMRWLRPGEVKPTDYERGEVSGPTAAASFRQRVRQMEPSEATAVGRMLLLENAHSVSHRYKEPLDVPEYEYTRHGGLSPVAVLKALSGFEYQACEHPGWKGSEAYAFCDALRLEAIRRLPGYDAAEWEVTA